MCEFCAEITVLGLVSVLFFIEQQAGLFRSLATRFGESFSSVLFEYIHFTFFIGILFYILVMVGIMYLSVRLSNNFREIQSEGRST
jgi:hypothetical protein